MTRVFPSQTSRVKSPGELPTWKPGIGSPPRSPPRRAVPGGRPAATACASSISPQGTTASQPLASAWTITVLAQDVHHHRDPAAEAPRRDQGRQQVHEHLGPVGRAHFRGCRHAIVPWLLRPTIMAYERRSGEVSSGAARMATPDPARATPATDPNPLRARGLGASATIDFTLPPFSGTLRLTRPDGLAVPASRPGRTGAADDPS